jgi:predicted metal-dependent phosphoesterase TrpH
MIEVDLHLHTTFSDGRLTPTELVGLCARRGLRTIAVTDHDSIEGIPEALEAARGFPGLEVIPGVELSADVPEGEVHLLGHFVDTADPTFRGILARLREGREERGLGMVKRLNELGVAVSWERVKELSDGGAIGRPHIALAMVEAGHIRYPKEAFDRYIGRNGPAYVGRARLTPVEAVEALVRNGALPVMAHPTFSMKSADSAGLAALESTLEQLKDAGLVGMEVYYKNYSPDQVSQLASIAKELGLVPCGGSDYHALGNPNEPEPGSVGPPFTTVAALRSLRDAASSS